MTSPLGLAHEAAILLGLMLFGIASLQDWASRLVPNSVPAAIALAGGLLRVADSSLMLGLIGAVLVFITATCCWRRGWLGGADVKLFAAGSLIVPPTLIVTFVLASCVAGGMLAILYIMLGSIVPHPRPGRPATRVGRYLRAEQWRLCRRGPLPYASAIAAGAYFALLRS